jgi:hypothetical protein
MESPQTPAAEVTTIRSTGVRYGLISGVVSIVFFLILVMSAVDMTSGPWQWLGWIITAALIFLAHKYYKDNTDGYMSYGQGIQIAMWMGMLSAVISSLFTYVYVKFIDASFVEMIREKQAAAMAEKGMTEEQIDQAMKIAAMFTTPEAMLGFGLVFGFLAVLVIALLVTIFTQKKAPETAF